MQRLSRRVATAPFGTTAAGVPVTMFTLANDHGLEVRLLDYGATVQSIWAPCKGRSQENVTLGYPTLAEYEHDRYYFGAMVGRYANRIARGRFAVDGQAYQLAVNDGPHHLHGGPLGFHRQVWRAEPFERSGGTGVVFSHSSPDGDQGYPGTLQVTVRCTLADDNALVFECAASCERATPVNLAQHSYFNLSGGRSADILAHQLTLHAKAFTPVDASLIPTGERRPVQGTPFDFTRATAVGARLADPDEQLGFGHGYDHNFVLDRAQPGTMTMAAVLYDPDSRRSLEVSTTQPGLQLYSGNALGHRGLALEAQRFPDSPNRPEFPDAIVRPGRPYSETTIYRFGWT